MAPKFFYAGVEHIMTGYDHLCFLLAVVLWASSAWPVIKIVTAFTVSHSITLTLAALQVVNLPSAWTEIAIALSIIYVAVENFFTRKVDGRWRDTFFSASSMGLASPVDSSSSACRNAPSCQRWRVSTLAWRPARLASCWS